jgi:hypothetical protein
VAGIDLLIACVFTYWLVKHAPELAADAIREIRAAITEDEIPTSDRARRLAEAGYDTADGGAFRRFTGNVWRDFWNDQRRAHNARRAGTPAPASKGPFRRLVDAWDSEVERRAQRWASQPRCPYPNFDRDTPVDDAEFTDHLRDCRKCGDRYGQLNDQPGPQPGKPDTFTTGDGPDFESTAHDSDQYPPGPNTGPCTGDPGCIHCHLEDLLEEKHDAAYSQRAADEPAAGPIRVDATVGNPIDDTPANTPLPLTAPDTSGQHQQAATSTLVLDQPEGPTDMTQTVATRGIAVTGVQSGAAECLSINQALDLAVAEFQQRLDVIGRRVHAMGDATLGLVQFAGTSDVVTRMAQAAEATAAAKAAARACGTEVGPLLMQTRTEFLRRA